MGRLTEACNVIKVVLASPFSPFYPEWQETLVDLKSKHKQRSIVAILQPEIEQKYSPQSEVQENVVRKARVRTVIDVMRNNLHRKLPLAELATAVNLSRSHLVHSFKAETGIPPNEYLIRLRMEKASELLATSFLSIKQVMVAVGYNSKSTFSDHFKRRFGVPPSEYRKRALT